MYRYLAGLLLVLICHSVTASNLAREQRIAEQIVDAILDGEPIWLEADGRQFLAIYTEASTEKTLGGVILLHGMGANPDWTDVIQPLRVNLPDRGWDTLSIQLPVAAGDAEFSDYLPLIQEAAPRIQAAVDYFKSQQNSNLILIGHSLGARMGLVFLSNKAPAQIQGFVAIGLSAPKARDKNPVLDALAKIEIPMLDLYGRHDLASVTQTAELRHKAADRAIYRQDMVEGADHFFHSLDTILISRVAAWIRRVASGIETENEPNGLK